MGFDLSLSMCCSHVGSSCVCVRRFIPCPVHRLVVRAGTELQALQTLFQTGLRAGSHRALDQLARRSSSSEITAACSKIPGIHTGLHCCFDMQTALCQTDCPSTSNPRATATGLSSWLCLIEPCSHYRNNFLLPSFSKTSPSHTTCSHIS